MRAPLSFIKDDKIIVLLFKLHCLLTVVFYVYYFIIIFCGRIRLGLTDESDDSQILHPYKYSPTNLDSEFPSNIRLRGEIGQKLTFNSHV